MLWEHTGSNRGPSACKADALNQLSYAPLINWDCKHTTSALNRKMKGRFDNQMWSYVLIFRYLIALAAHQFPPTGIKAGNWFVIELVFFIVFLRALPLFFNSEPTML